jgi:hypothetical protein
MMKTFRCVAAIASLYVAIIAAMPADKDGLIQVNLAEFPKYRAVLVKKLGSTRFDCGRVVFKPAFVPEYSVSVYSKTSKDQYFATYIKAEQNLNDLLEPGADRKKAKLVKTRIVTCEMPRHIAEELRQAWIGMLSGKQHPRPMTLQDAVRATDATVGEFSIQLPNETLYGEVLEAESPLGRKTTALVELANMLIGYCQAEPTHRPAIEHEIDRKATRLLEMLNKEL